MAKETRMKSLRRLVRKIILENVQSKAKTIQELIPGTHRLVVNSSKSGVRVELWYEGDDYSAAHFQCVPTNNRKVHMLGAAYIDDPKADGFGPLLSDICMELTTANGKWLAMDRASATEDAQKLWQYYRDHRLDIDVKGLQLDNSRNVMTPKKSDNIDSRMADEVMMGFGSKYWSASDQKEYQRQFYRENALMWAFKKDPTLIAQLQNMPEIYEEN